MRRSLLRVWGEPAVCVPAPNTAQTIAALARCAELLARERAAFVECASRPDGSMHDDDRAVLDEYDQALQTADLAMKVNR